MEKVTHYDASTKEYFIYFLQCWSSFKYWSVTGNKATEIEILNLRKKTQEYCIL